MNSTKSMASMLCNSRLAFLNMKCLLTMMMVASVVVAFVPNHHYYCHHSSRSSTGRRQSDVLLSSSSSSSQLFNKPYDRNDFNKMFNDNDDDDNYDDDNFSIQSPRDLERALNNDQLFAKSSSSSSSNNIRRPLRNPMMNAQAIEQLREMALQELQGGGGDNYNKNYTTSQAFIDEFKEDDDDDDDDDRPFLDQMAYIQSCRNMQPDGSVDLSMIMEDEDDEEDLYTDAVIESFQPNQYSSMNRPPSSRRQPNQPEPTLEDLMRAYNQNRQVDPELAKRRGEDIKRRVFENEEAYLQNSKDFQEGLTDQKKAEEAKAKRRSQKALKIQNEQAEKLQKEVDNWLDEFDDIQKMLKEQREFELKLEIKKKREAEEAKKKKEAEDLLSNLADGFAMPDGILEDEEDDDDDDDDDVTIEMQSLIDASPVGDDDDDDDDGNTNKNAGYTSRFPDRELFESANIGATREGVPSILYDRPPPMSRSRASTSGAGAGRQRAGRSGATKTGARGAGRGGGAGRGAGGSANSTPTQAEIDQFRSDFMFSGEGYAEIDRRQESSSTSEDDGSSRRSDVQKNDARPMFTKRDDLNDGDGEGEWVEVDDPSTGEHFYWNTETGEMKTEL